MIDVGNEEEYLKIAILGAGSFIGKNLSWDLSLHNDAEVWAFYRTMDSFLEKLGDRKNVTLKSFDFSIPSSYRDDAFWASVDHVVCLVSYSKPSTYNHNPILDFKKNVIPYMNFLKYLQGRYFGHIIYFSSGGTVYGNRQARLPISESTPVDPLSSYGMSKVSIELLVRNVSAVSGFHATILRLGNPIGRWQVLRDGQGLLPSLIKSIKTNSKFTLFGGGETVRDYFDVREISTGLDFILRKDNVWNNIYNFGSGSGRTVHDIIQEIEFITEKKVHLINQSKRDFDIGYNVLNCDKLQKAINWVPKSRVDGAIRDALLEFK